MRYGITSTADEPRTSIEISESMARATDGYTFVAVFNALAQIVETTISKHSVAKSARNERSAMAAKPVRERQRNPV
jgi:hypothetical protein